MRKIFKIHGELDENQILTFIKEQNEEGIKLLFKYYFDELYGYCFRLINNREDSEDIIQAIFIDIWENGHKRDIKYLKPYLYQMVKFKVYTYWANKKDITDVIDNFNKTLATDELRQSIESEDLENNIKAIIQLLPPACLKIFELSRFEELSHSEIAERLNISKQTVKNQLCSAVKFIKLHMTMFLLLF